VSRRLRLAALVLLPLALCAGSLQAQDEVVESPDATTELYRVRIENRPGAAVEISSDGGRLWDLMGKVTRVATSVSPSSNVITAVRPGGVSGVTPEHLTLRVPANKDLFKLLRVQAAGQPESPAAIATDIPVSGALFRCLAPPVGSGVTLEREGKTEPLPVNYVPLPGDRLTIIVRRGETFPAEVVLQNKPDGEVSVVTKSGSRVVGRVKQPLRGIGRYAGTERAGSGALVSWSPTVVVVSSAATLRRFDDKDQQLEDRGGFIIQPAEPNLQGSTNPASQILIEGIAGAESKPAISPFFGLPIPVSSGDPLDPVSTIIQVRIDGGDWESLPDLRGPVTPEKMIAALQEAVGPQRTIKEGITHLRILFDNPTPASLSRRIKLAIAAGTDQPQRGAVKITANVMGEGIAIVSFFLDGQLTMATNRQPYTWEWNTLKTPNGPHLVEIRGTDARGAIVTSVLRRVLVDN
jgi:hypothetical protein